MGAAKIRVLVVDDSALARKMISDALSSHPDVEVIGTAVDPFMARDKILSLKPDVMTLDVEMPRMDGLTFLKLIMRHRPMPVIVLSSITQDGSAKALEALQSGAVDVVGKPIGNFSFTEAANLAEKVKAAAHARLANAISPYRGEDRALGSALVAPANLPNSRALIVLGASTGGTEALKTVLTQLPNDLPPIAIVQHIPAQFSAAFANRLNGLCDIEVREARHGDELAPGTALVAPGGKHLLLKWNGSRYHAAINESAPLHHQRPAVDILFDSVAKVGGARSCIAGLLTGMGRDGAEGMLKLRQGGAHTIAQSEATCVVFGMPREAINLGAVEEILDLEDIADELTRHGRRLSTLAPAAELVT